MNKLFFILILFSLAFPSQNTKQTPVELHGNLYVKGNKIYDQHNNTVQLRGMSLFWSQWMEQFYNKKTVQWLVNDWKITVIRAAMGIKHEPTLSGYYYNGAEKRKIETVIEAALKEGIYVIVDWHDHNAHEHEQHAIRFFKEMASKYGEYPNVIYEIYNEPEKVSWTKTVKPYSERIVETIREIDPDNLIIIGTPSWCQDVDEAADDPLKGKNLVYALHFYAATHGAELRQKAQYALNKNIPLFVSEFGTCLASGDGFLDSTETELWFDFMDKNHLSWCNWSIGNKNETASALIPGARYYGQWKVKHLTRSGRIIRHKLRWYSGIREDYATPEKKKNAWLKIKPVTP